MKKYKVHYQIATYSGTAIVFADENAVESEIIAKCKAQLIHRTGALPQGYQSFKIEEA